MKISVGFYAVYYIARLRIRGKSLVWQWFYLVSEKCILINTKEENKGFDLHPTLWYLHSIHMTRDVYPKIACLSSHTFETNSAPNALLDQS
jgi:hypothetical protein